MTSDFKAVNGERLHSVDALRGFALVAILLVHLPEYLIYDVYGMVPEAVKWPPVWQSMAKLLADALFFLFAGKSYSIFAMLFGVTFAIQYGRRAEKGGDFCGRFLWRMLWLALFGCLNAIFYPGGDVLLLFAVFGIVMVPFRKAGAVWVAVAAFIFLLQPLHLAYALIGWFDPGWHAPSMLAASTGGYAELKGLMMEGNFLKMIWADLTTGQFASFAWAVDHGRITQVPGLFLMGCALGKAGRFAMTAGNANFWVKVFTAILAAMPVLYVLKSSDGFSAEFRLVFEAWYNVAFSGIWVSLFLLFYQVEGFRKIVSPLNNFGKMSLTNYIMQAVVGSFVFFPWGFYLSGRIDPIPCVLVGVVLAVIQIKASGWWLSRHRQGPLETVWHKLTWMNFPRKG